MGKFSFYEFFCGGGMARAGLGEGWSCLFANDFDANKAKSYVENWGGREFKCADVGALRPDDLPGCADLAWASFPCQDLSLAGLGAGLSGERSGAFWPFWRLMQGLGAQRRAPPLIVLENVRGALTSNGGADFRALCAALAQSDYRYGALLIDAVDCLPQSRPRLFVIAVARDLPIPAALVAGGPSPQAHPRALVDAVDDLAASVRNGWLWWRLPAPARRNVDLIDLIEPDPRDAKWRSRDETQRLIALMSPANLEKLATARRAGRPTVGAVYRRTRRDADGARRQRAEVRFDGLAGCLRTPAGGSSRQTLIFVEGAEVRSRLVSAREAARLMGLPDSYRLPLRANDAYHLLGDGVAVPVVRRLAESLLEPILAARQETQASPPARRTRRA